MVGSAESKLISRTVVWDAFFSVSGAVPILLCRGLFPEIFENPLFYAINMKYTKNV